jgi:hypothetical protein
MECCPVSSAGKLVSSLAIELNVSGGDAYYESSLGAIACWRLGRFTWDAAGVGWDGGGVSGILCGFKS